MKSEYSETDEERKNFTFLEYRIARRWQCMAVAGVLC